MKLNSKIRQILSFVLFIREGLISDKIGLITYCKQMLSLFLTCTQFLNAKIFYMGNRGYYNYIFLKGEIMGLDGLQFDAVKKFNASMEQSNEEMRQQMEAKNITVPIVAQQPKDLEKGLTVQADPKNKEEKDKTTAPINAVNDGQGAVEKTAVETDDADPNVKAQQEEVQKDEAQTGKKVADETPKTAVEEIADNRKAQQAKTEEAKKAEVKPEAKQQEAKPEDKTPAIDPLDEKLQRAIRYDDKDAIKACQAEIADRFKYKYNEYGDKLIATDDETAAKKAKSYVENAKKADKFERTILTNSGAECTLVKNELKAKKEALIAQYQAEGLSKKEAKKRAEAELPNRVVDLSDHAVLFGVVKKGYRKAYNFINRPENRERFFYENGRLNSDAVKAFFRDEVANADTDFEGGEVTNFRATLPEQGKAAVKYNVKRSAMGQGARAAGLYSDKDRTPLYVAGLTVAGTAIGAGVGAVLSGSAATLSGAAANAAATTACAEATADAVAVAGAEVTWNLVGAGAATGGGVGLGLSRFLTDKGRKEDRVYGFYRKPEPVEQGKVHKLNLHLDVHELMKPTVILPKEEDCVNTFFYEPTCTHTVERGQSWWTIAEGTVLFDNKPIRGKEVKAYKLAQQLRYGMTDAQIRRGDFFKVGTEYVEYSDFTDQLTEENLKKYPILKLLVGKKISFNCDGKIAKSRVVRGHSQVTNNSSQTIQYQRDCKTQQVSRVR